MTGYEKCGGYESYAYVLKISACYFRKIHIWKFIERAHKQNVKL